MEGSIIIISILVILLWFYFMKYSEQESKFLPVMLKQKQVISRLKDENIKIKSELKYLHNYKNDVSKTFQILDNELVMINDRIKQTETVPSNQFSTQNQPRSSFQTSFNPSILNTLLNSASIPTQQTQPTQPTQVNENEQLGGDLFNIFNRFLTGQNVSNFEFSIPSDIQSNILSSDISSGILSSDISSGILSSDISSGILSSDISSGISSGILSSDIPSSDIPSGIPSLDTSSSSIPSSDVNVQRSSLQFSTNILPLNNSYRRFLLNREQVEEPQQNKEHTSII